MTNRAVVSKAIIARTKWAGVTPAPLAGDASNRIYHRLTDPATHQTAVLMDADPQKGEDVRPFVQAANYLRDLGLSAPEILAEDEDFGFLLLEDLGDDLFARVAADQPELERALYEAATDVLIHLHQSPVMELDSYGPRMMTQRASMAFSHYAAGITGEDQSDIEARFTKLFQDILMDTASGPKVVVLRDYHAENLLWLPDRSGLARVGLLDFQDAMLGHPAYDLMSLLQDIRRTVPAGIEMTMINRYLQATGIDEHAFRQAYAVLGVQRNMRILGVFARLAVERDKPGYVDLMPPTWNHLVRGLNHPALASVSDLILKSLPAPTPANMQKLKNR
ncbi:aminoglycoside phosphotransferase family protein [Tropicibacter sp. Alg240-R139]|uniref:aminoglycoside phosphotransferase family protein n=1 Tax=Tropicibacter sp. Alg240-R139 TaxID=2305991 RepID=UPI0013E0BA3E|nr:phosphotransferase [Tropicibacter sp. Alg240-R139]